jgi:hypothetical protein
MLTKVSLSASQSQYNVPMTAAEQKTETLNLRVSPSLKAALQAAAGRERRSMANMVEYLVVEYCEAHQIKRLEMLDTSTGPMGTQTKQTLA